MQKIQNMAEANELTNTMLNKKIKQMSDLEDKVEGDLKVTYQEIEKKTKELAKRMEVIEKNEEAEAMRDNLKKLEFSLGRVNLRIDSEMEKLEETFSEDLKNDIQRLKSNQSKIEKMIGELVPREEITVTLTKLAKLLDNEKKVDQKIDNIVVSYEKKIEELNTKLSATTTDFKKKLETALNGQEERVFGYVQDTVKAKLDGKKAELKGQMEEWKEGINKELLKYDRVVAEYEVLSNRVEKVENNSKDYISLMTETKENKKEIAALKKKKIEIEEKLNDSSRLNESGLEENKKATSSLKTINLAIEDIVAELEHVKIVIHDKSLENKVNALNVQLGGIKESNGDLVKEIFELKEFERESRNKINALVNKVNEQPQTEQPRRKESVHKYEEFDELEKNINARYESQHATMIEKMRIIKDEIVDTINTMQQSQKERVAFELQEIRREIGDSANEAIISMEKRLEARIDEQHEQTMTMRRKSQLIETQNLQMRENLTENEKMLVALERKIAELQKSTTNEINTLDGRISERIEKIESDTNIQLEDRDVKLKSTENKVKELSLEVSKIDSQRQDISKRQEEKEVKALEESLRKELDKIHSELENMNERLNKEEFERGKNKESSGKLIESETLENKLFEMKRIILEDLKKINERVTLIETSIIDIQAIRNELNQIRTENEQKYCSIELATRNKEDLLSKIEFEKQNLLTDLDEKIDKNNETVLLTRNPNNLTTLPMTTQDSEVDLKIEKLLNKLRQEIEEETKKHKIEMALINQTLKEMQEKEKNLEETMNFKNEMDASEIKQDSDSKVVELQTKLDRLSKEVTQTNEGLVVVSTKIDDMRARAKKYISTDELNETTQRQRKETDARLFEVEENIKKQIAVVEERLANLDKGIKSDFDLFEDDPPFTYKSRHLLSGYVNNKNSVFQTSREHVVEFFEDDKVSYWQHFKSVSNDVPIKEEEKKINLRDAKLNNIYNKTEAIDVKVSEVLGDRFCPKYCRQVISDEVIMEISMTYDEQSFARKSQRSRMTESRLSSQIKKELAVDPNDGMFSWIE